MSDLGRWPTFLVIGAAKSATTSLHVELGRHPSVYLPALKEIMFFSHDKNYVRGWQWYLSRFHDAGDALAIGEVSPQYAHRARYPDTAERIAKCLPDVKLIFIARNPLERIRSNWRHARRSKSEAFDFNTILRDPKRNTSFITVSKYWYQISA